MDDNFNILIVDEEKKYFDTVKPELLAHNYSCSWVNTAQAAIDFLIKSKVDLIVIDFRLSVINDFQIIDDLNQISPDTEVIILSDNMNANCATDAIKKGVFAYLPKHNDSFELFHEITKIKTINKYKGKIERSAQYSYFLESENEAFNRALSLASRAADSKSSILLLGESGVGKEVFASYIHNLSPRRNNEFVAVNCNAFSESLLQSELYGHEKGSFTGAFEKRIGRIEAANKGTLFLDEIGDTSLNVQLNLLRVLDTKKIERIGSNQLIDIDFRLICATNKDIKQSIEEKKFREDFYYRISTIVIKIPSLRERKEDLKKLINYFINLFSEELKKNIVHIEDEALKLLMNYRYPGNIRELKNIIERLVVLSSGGVIKASDICEEINTIVSDTSSLTLKDVRIAAERAHIIKTLLINDYNMTNTSEQLGISRRHLLNKINEYGIDKP